MLTVCCRGSSLQNFFTALAERDGEKTTKKKSGNGHSFRVVFKPQHVEKLAEMTTRSTEEEEEVTMTTRMLLEAKSGGGKAAEAAVDEAVADLKLEKVRGRSNCCSLVTGCLRKKTGMLLRRPPLLCMQNVR